MYYPRHCKQIAHLRINKVQGSTQGVRVLRAYGKPVLASSVKRLKEQLVIHCTRSTQYAASLKKLQYRVGLNFSCEESCVLH